MSTDDRPLTVGEFRRALEATSDYGPCWRNRIDAALATLDAAPVPQAEEESAGAFLQRLGMDGQLWAKEFRATAQRLGYGDMDEGWLIGWFCNAIMAGYDRRGQEQPVPQAQDALPEHCALCNQLTNNGVPHCIQRSEARALRDALEASRRECERLQEHNAALEKSDDYHSSMVSKWQDAERNAVMIRIAAEDRAEQARRECERLTDQVHRFGKTIGQQSERISEEYRRAEQAERERNEWRFKYEKMPIAKAHADGRIEGRAAAFAECEAKLQSFVDDYETRASEDVAAGRIVLAAEKKIAARTYRTAVMNIAALAKKEAK